MLSKSNREVASSQDLNSSQITYSHNTIQFNGMTLRPGSPRTMTACTMLGIDEAVFQIKEYNDFYGNDGSNSPEIIRIRYQHYVNKTYQLLTEIFIKRKEIVKRARALQQQYGSIDSLDRSKSVKQQGYTLDQAEVKKQMDHVYNKAIFKIQTSTTNQKKDALINDYEGFPQNSQACDSADVQEFEGGLNKELSRYNKHKIQKIREAQIKLDEDKKRVELLEKLQQRESRVVQAMMKKQQDMKEKYMQRKHQQKSVDTQEAEVKSQPEEYELQKNASSQEKLYDRLSVARSKHENNTDDQKEKKKRQLAIFRKEEFEKQIDQDCQQNMLKIQQKLEQSEKLQREQIQSKIEKIKEQNLKEQLIVKQQRELKERLSQQHFNSLLQKMVSKEKEFQTNQQSIMTMEQEKKMEQKQKQRKIKLNQGDLFLDRDQKLKQLNEKFLKIDEFNKLKKEELENKILLKQELRKLKEQDKQDIIERQKRQNEFKMIQMTQKYRQMDDKNSLKQYQNALLQQTSMQISKQEIIERNRIYSQLSQMSDNLFNKKIRKRNQSTLEQNLLTIKQKGNPQKEDTEFEDHTRLLITMLQTNQLQEIKTSKPSIKRIN